MRPTSSRSPCAVLVAVALALATRGSATDEGVKDYGRLEKHDLEVLSELLGGSGGIMMTKQEGDANPLAYEGDEDDEFLVDAGEYVDGERRMLGNYTPKLTPLEGDNLYCSSTAPGALVFNTTDGIRTRCFVVIPPPGVPEEMYPLPVFLFFHGTNGFATDCGNNPDMDDGYTWRDVGEMYGFIIVCPEATQYPRKGDVAFDHGGVWFMPPYVNDTTGPRCDAEDSYDNVYMANLIALLEECPETFDTSRMVTHGCSGGSSMAFWQATCLHLTHGGVNAFATHSTGLKIKGDGIYLGSALYTRWGECDECQYFPTLVRHTPNLYACIFDNYDDPNEDDPFYYATSLQLAAYWEAYQNPHEEHFGYGGHCATHSRAAIARCLDQNHSGMLITQWPDEESSTTEATCSDEVPENDEFHCQYYVDNDKCATTHMQGYCCQSCHDCSAKCTGITTPDPSASTATPTTTAKWVANPTCIPRPFVFDPDSTTTTTTTTTTTKETNSNNNDDDDDDDDDDEDGSSNGGMTVVDTVECEGDGWNGTCFYWQYAAIAVAVVTLLVIVAIFLVVRKMNREEARRQVQKGNRDSFSLGPRDVEMTQVEAASYNSGAHATSRTRQDIEEAKLAAKARRMNGGGMRASTEGKYGGNGYEDNRYEVQHVHEVVGPGQVRVDRL